MKIIAADPTRMIDLPGVGPCPRPVDIDQTQTGFDTLKSLRIYDFKAGQTINGESEGDEVFVIPLSGRMQIEVTGRHALTANLARPGAETGLYMPPDHAYRLTASSDVKVAYARAAAVGDVATQVVGAPDSNGIAETLVYSILTLTAGERGVIVDGEQLIHVCEGGLDVGGEHVDAGQTVALSHGEPATLTALGACTLLRVSA